jgi:hypothetical protein
MSGMRGVAKYIWFFIFIAFVGGFLLADMSGLIGMGVSPATTVAKVNGEEVPYIAWENLTRSLVQQQEQQSGRSLNFDERRQVEEQAFSQIVSDILLQQEYEKRGIRVTDQEIIDAARFSPPPQFYNTPELQTDGRFDPAKYQRFLESPVARQQGLLAQLEGYYRTELPRNKLFSQLIADVWVSDEKLWQDFRDERDSASVTFVALRPTAEEIAATEVSDAEARAYYEKYDGRWEAPGRAVVSIVSIDRTPTAADTAATVARMRELRAEITSGRTSFADPPGVRGLGDRSRRRRSRARSAWTFRGGVRGRRLRAAHGPGLGASAHRVRLALDPGHRTEGGHPCGASHPALGAAERLRGDGVRPPGRQLGVVRRRGQRACALRQHRHPTRPPRLAGDGGGRPDDAVCRASGGRHHGLGLLRCQRR